MASMNKIDSISRQYFSPVDAVKLYTNINNRSVTQVNDEAKAFIGARQGLGVGAICFAGEGQLNGMPPAQYNEFGEEIPRTLDFFA